MISSNVLSINEAVKQICAGSSPVLFIDTCILLDVIRSPIRKYNQSVVPGLKIRDILKSNPNSLNLVITKIVETEWNDNYEKVKIETIKWVKEFEGYLLTYRELSRDFGFENIKRPLINPEKIGNKLFDLSKDLIENSIIIDYDHDCQHRAHIRVTTNIPPAKRGGQSKDCDIIEHYIELSRQLKQNNFDKKRIFLSSNTRDYCITGYVLHDNLKKDFKLVDLEYTTNLAGALNELSN